MKITAPKPQNTIESDSKGSGLGHAERLERGAEDEKKEGVPQNAPTHPKRQRFDKEGRPLISKGVLLRKDLDKKYKLKAALMGTDKYILINVALEYYYENVLKKTQAQKLLEAGQEGLNI